MVTGSRQGGPRRTGGGRIRRLPESREARVTVGPAQVPSRGLRTLGPLGSASSNPNLSPAQGSRGEAAGGGTPTRTCRKDPHAEPDVPHGGGGNETLKPGRARERLPEGPRPVHKHDLGGRTKPALPGTRSGADTAAQREQPRRGTGQRC